MTKRRGSKPGPRLLCARNKKQGKKRKIGIRQKVKEEKTGKIEVREWEIKRETGAGKLGKRTETAGNPAEMCPLFTIWPHSLSPCHKKDGEKGRS